MAWTSLPLPSSRLSHAPVQGVGQWEVVSGQPARSRLEMPARSGLAGAPTPASRGLRHSRHSAVCVAAEVTGACPERRTQAGARPGTGDVAGSRTAAQVRPCSAELE